MTRRSARIGTLFATAAMTFALGSPAEARRSVADKPEFFPVSAAALGCALGDPACAAFTLPFSVKFGATSTDQVFAYQNGLISFGSRVSGGLPASSTFDQYGVPVIAPLAFTTQALGSALPFYVGYNTADSVTYDTPLSAGTGKFAIFAFDDDDGSSLDSVFLLLRKAASGDDLLFEFVHGSCFCIQGDPPELPDLANAAFGYNLGSQSLFKNNLTADDIEDTLSFRYSPSGTAPAVPEPASWVMMLLGFALAGTAIRQRRVKERRLATA